MGSFQIKFYQERKGIVRAPYVKIHLPTRILFFLDITLIMRKRSVKKSCKRCYEITSSTSRTGFDAQRPSDVESRLRCILPILRKSMRTVYADYVWDRLRTAIGWRDDDAVETSGDRGLKPVTNVVDWYNRTERIISVISEYIPGYKPTKRSPSYCCICWSYDVRKSAGPRARCNCRHRCVVYYRHRVRKKEMLKWSPTVVK